MQVHIKFIILLTSSVAFQLLSVDFFVTSWLLFIGKKVGAKYSNRDFFSWFHVLFHGLKMLHGFEDKAVAVLKTTSEMASEWNRCHFRNIDFLKLWILRGFVKTILLEKEFYSKHIGSHRSVLQGGALSPTARHSSEWLSSGEDSFLHLWNTSAGSDLLYMNSSPKWEPLKLPLGEVHQQVNIGQPLNHFDWSLLEYYILGWIPW